jgi:hypothetical protein
MRENPGLVHVYVWQFSRTSHKLLFHLLKHKFLLFTPCKFSANLWIFGMIAEQSWQEFLLIIVSAASSASFPVDTNSTSDAALGVPSTATQQQIRDAYKRYLFLSPPSHPTLQHQLTTSQGSTQNPPRPRPHRLPRTRRANP